MPLASTIFIVHTLVFRPGGAGDALARSLGVTLRSLYRFIDEGALTAYRFGRVIRLMEGDLDGFIESRRIEPGTLEHLYPDPKTATGNRSHGASPDDAEVGS